ncbi:hypothetical protein N4R57_17060 [Rhodobacteraceae bacterium D3-12]|nr:hypothetical protein N4R57_17060 [Rhodobacteraceae bacterium D3-12]
MIRIVLAVIAAFAVSGPVRAGCVMDHWGRFLAPEPQTLEKIETIHSPKGDILAFRLSPFTGEYAKLYVLMLDDSNCLTKAAIVGSYAKTQKFHAEKLKAEGKPVTRLFHMDLYDGDQHSTLGFLEGDAPSYESVKARLIKALQ